MPLVELGGELRDDGAKGLELLEDSATGSQTEASEEFSKLILQAPESSRGCRANDGGDTDLEEVLVTALQVGTQGLGLPRARSGVGSPRREVATNWAAL